MAHPAQSEKEQRSPAAMGQSERQPGGMAQQQKPAPESERGQVRSENQPRPGEATRSDQRQSGGMAQQPEQKPAMGAPGGQLRSETEPRSGEANRPGQTSNAMNAHPHGNATAGSATATGNVRISNQNAASVADALMSMGHNQTITAPVNVGAPLPGDVDLLPLPPAVVALVPEYQGSDYVVVNDEIVIVQPTTRQVVEIIRPGGVAQATETPPAGLNLTDSQRRLLLDSVRDERLPGVQIAELANGETVPQDVELQPAPSAVVAEIPMIERYRVFMANDQVVLVDPQTRAVVDIVR